jgi:hypothetical protein
MANAPRLLHQLCHLASVPAEGEQLTRNGSKGAVQAGVTSSDRLHNRDSRERQSLSRSRAGHPDGLQKLNPKQSILVE